LKRLRRLGPHLAGVRPVQIENLLHAQFTRRLHRFVKHGIGDNNGQTGIEKVIEALGGGQRDQRQASVTIMATSIDMTQQRLEDRARPRQVCIMLGRSGGLGQIEVLLRQRDHQIGVIMDTQALDCLARAKASGGILA